MIVVDMESSGLDPYKNSLVSVGAVDFDNPKNQFYQECRVWDGAHIEDEALAVNGFSRAQIIDPKKPSDREVVEAFLAWMKTCKEWTIAGQNPNTDRDFLRMTALRYHINWPLAHRIIDLHSIAYFHMKRRGIEPPLKNNHSDLNLDKILTYVGLPTEPKPHIALNGAKYEAEAFSRLFYDKPFFAEFNGYEIPWVKSR